MPMFMDLLKSSEYINLEKGQRLYEEGDSANFFYFVMEGSLVLSLPP
jgi:CRP-like cAMP-binding protein